MKSLLIFVFLFQFQALARAEYRPDGQVVIENVCLCKKGFPLAVQGCTSFCQEKNESTPMLYASVSLKSKIALNPLFISPGKNFGELKNWCQKEIQDGRIAPHCLMEVTDADSGGSLMLTPSYFETQGLVANISVLTKGRRYILKVKEQTSGASSTQLEFNY